ncbi:MAG: hypothetical protein KF773_19400 [Deltaproteobacteria bacterium]|nr:hypothetical protein [Deltaproteobacteria bacterium]MCW5802775.1 hypothetical protein [Deltaproteobacteria bacterium]
MAEKVSLFQQWLWGDWADRDIINRNADALEDVELTVGALKKAVARQSEDILRLRTTVSVLLRTLAVHAKITESELEIAIGEEWAKVVPPPKEPPSRKAATDPYRGLPADEEPTPADIEAAKALMRIAEGHHFEKQFAQAREVYQDIVDRYGATKQAAAAARQLENLRGL